MTSLPTPAEYALMREFHFSLIEAQLALDMIQRGEIVREA